MITVGLDFGTHQSKVCIERKEGVELEYHFIKFEDSYRNEHYTLPSVISLNNDGTLSYGYINRRTEGQIIRYFKQAAFCSTKGLKLSQKQAMYFAIWYISYILFDLEDIYGQNFSIQMGAPADTAHLDDAKEIATSIVASAYRLVEDVFKNDKQKFLNTKADELIGQTVIVPYSQEIKDEYQLRVYPEAYACLKPLVAQKKIGKGMSLMVDIGGGTTDISFFTIEEGKPQVYDFYSIDKGLNYLTMSETEDGAYVSIDSRVRESSQIDDRRRNTYIKEVNKVCGMLEESLKKEFKNKTNYPLYRLLDALKTRPLIYCGGGSTFKIMRVAYGGFKDKRVVTGKEWNQRAVRDIDEISDKNLCPILSTAYGLSISEKDDNIVCKPLASIFDSMSRAMAEEGQFFTMSSSFGSAIFEGFSYTDCWDAMK